ncbi:MAG: hypothetical protein PUJ11_03590 [Eubacteriaceae bacterium]|nr:hypothetical protein [Eubacteriaceae bacterium]
MKMLNDEKVLDKALSEVFSEASMLYQQENFKDTDVDELFVHSLIKKKRRRSLLRFTRSSAVVALVLVTGVSISVWSQVEGVYGGKHFIQKCVSMISPLSTEELINDAGEVVTITTVTDESDITKAKKVFPNLKIAKHIPEGYCFNKLTISKSSSMSSVEYLYSKGESILAITFQYGTEDADIMVVGEEYISPNTGQKMYVYEDTKENIYSIIEIDENYDCIVTGRAHKEEGIQVIESIDNL